jgi:hypothetical protein
MTVTQAAATLGYDTPAAFSAMFAKRVERRERARKAWILARLPPALKAAAVYELHMTSSAGCAVGLRM